MAGEHHVD